MDTAYQAALDALEVQSPEVQSPLAEIERRLEKLAATANGAGTGIDQHDKFGLTIAMRAAGCGRCDALDAACRLGARIEQRNPYTGATVLHYAAQQRKGGAEVLDWVARTRGHACLLAATIFRPGAERDVEDRAWDRGNGHTPAFEAVFNNNEAFIEALVALEQDDYPVDFTTRAVHGASPLAWAFKYNMDAIIRHLMSRPAMRRTSRTAAEAEERERTNDYIESHKKAWIEAHGDEAPALALADRLRRYIVGSGSLAWLNREADGIDLNKPYGRFGQPLLSLVPTDPLIMNNGNPDTAQKQRYTEVVAAVLTRGADPTVREKGLMEVSAGFREVFFGYTDALKLMIESVADPDLRAAYINEVGFFNGYTRLIDAALIPSPEVIDLLERYGADRTIRGFNGRTAAST